jgi:hypothetical protein
VPAPVAAAGAATGAAKGAGAQSAAGAGGTAGRMGAQAALQGGGEPQQGVQDDARTSAGAVVALALAPFLLVLFATAVFVAVFGGISATQHPAEAGESYPAGSEIPAVYWPMYATAGRYYGVNPYLLASIHKQETGFSTHPSTRAGVNFAGCCAGPMQFNVVDGTWDAYKNGFRPIRDSRPASYPLQRTRLPSCALVPDNTGCVYDDFDAIAAAAAKLKAGGANTSLYSAGTRRAVCAYIGSCSEVDKCTLSINQYCQVLPRARDWELRAAAPAPASGARAIVENAVVIAKRYPDVYVCSDFRSGSITTSGNVSDHSSNDGYRAARDISARGIDCITGPPPPSLDQAAVAIGQSFGRHYRLGTTIIDTFAWKGFRVQIIWRTPLYGGHMGHIHVGARRL